MSTMSNTPVFTTATAVAKKNNYHQKALTSLAHSRIMQMIIVKGGSCVISSLSELGSVLQNDSSFKALSVMLGHEGIVINKKIGYYVVKVSSQSKVDATVEADCSEVYINKKLHEKLTEALIEEAIAILKLNVIDNGLTCIKIHKNRFIELKAIPAVDAKVNEFFIENKLNLKVGKGAKAKQLYPHN